MAENDSKKFDWLPWLLVILTAGLLTRPWVKERARDPEIWLGTSILFVSSGLVWDGAYVDSVGWAWALIVVGWVMAVIGIIVREIR